ncbi:hypothetical protein BD779DRAFT_1526078 [Infundibulicybe gibba]|nr:hypothetical protein BD779DRAFT_1526078 [Infundibulicybe gibba]
MWCTRWFLPLLLLPIPTASPYFLLLFLFSLAMHAKPCFYCIVLLATLFVSSCYWQPFPMDSSLSVPWADNITTFAEASTLRFRQLYPSPSVRHAGSFFEPFNVTQWERVSVQRVKEDLERELQFEQNVLTLEETQTTQTDPSSTKSSEMPRTPAPSPTTNRRKIARMSTSELWSLLQPLGKKLRLQITSRYFSHETRAPQPTPPPKVSIGTANDDHKPKIPENLPLIRKEYDLRPYGVGILIDFAWTR